MVELDSPADPGGWEFNVLAYDGSRQMLKLSGFENYPRSDVKIGSPEVRGVRLGYHPGAELHLVFDLQNPRIPAAEVEARGNRIELFFRP